MKEPTLYDVLGWCPVCRNRGMIDETGLYLVGDGTTPQPKHLWRKCWCCKGAPLRATTAAS